MNRLPLVDFRLMEKVALQLGFTVVRQRGSHVFSIDILTGGQQPCLIMEAVT
jgi:hypothetical protein